MSRSTPPPTLPEDGKLEATGEKKHQVEPEKEKQTAESNESSIMASSTANGVEKQETPEDDVSATEEKAVEEPQKPVEYPKGIEMFFIMLALVLSITLCSLDQVSSITPSFSQSRLLPMHHTRHANIRNSDHCCNRCSKDHRPIRQTSGYLVVRFGLFPDARSVPVAVGQSVQILSSQNRFPGVNPHLRTWEFD